VIEPEQKQPCLQIAEELKCLTVQNIPTNNYQEISPKTRILTSVACTLPCQEDEACDQQFEYLIGTNQTGSLNDGEVHTDHIPLAPASVASPYKNKIVFTSFSPY
jgi:hypothetical protein